MSIRAFGAVAAAMVVVLAVSGTVTLTVQSRATAAEAQVAHLVNGRVPACLGATSIGVAACQQTRTDHPIPDPSVAGDDIGGAYGPACFLENVTIAKDCVSGDVGSKIKIALIGDSHAAAWYEPLRRLAVQHGWEMHTFFKAACPFDDTAYATPVSVVGDCNTWTRNVEKAVADSHYALVVTSASRTAYTWGSTPAPTIEAGFRSAWSTIGRSGKLVVLRDVPTMTSDALYCQDFRSQSASRCTVTTAEGTGGPTDYAWKTATSDADVVPIDLTDDFCLAGTCPTVIGGVTVYRDVSSHITSTYAITMTQKLGDAIAAHGAMPRSAQ